MHIYIDEKLFSQNTLCEHGIGNASPHFWNGAFHLLENSSLHSIVLFFQFVIFSKSQKMNISSCPYHQEIELTVNNLNKTFSTVHINGGDHSQHHFLPLPLDNWVSAVQPV